jgi:hypothetical protein
MKTLKLALLAASVAVGFAVVASNAADDPLSGTWMGDWGPSASDRNQVTVELKWDGKNLTGTVNPGANAVELKNTKFDSKTGAVHMEADAKGRRGNEIHYVIDGKVEGKTMTGTWSHDNRKGDFKITKG